MQALRGLLLPGRLSTVLVSLSFFNMLCTAFLRKLVCRPLCCVPLQILTFYQNLVAVTEYYVNYC